MTRLGTWALLVVAIAACAGDDDTTPTDTDAPELSEDDFLVLFEEEYCELLEACESDRPCVGIVGGDALRCTYFPERARSCLDAEWSCDPESGFIVAAEVCSTVWECLDTTEKTY